MDSQTYTAFDGLYQELSKRIDHYLEMLATDEDMAHLDIVNELTAVRSQLHGEWMILAHPRRQTRDTPQDAGPAVETADKDADKNVGGHGATEDNRGTPEDGQEGPAKDRPILYYWFDVGEEPNNALHFRRVADSVPPDAMTYRDPAELAMRIAADLMTDEMTGANGEFISGWAFEQLTARIRKHLTGDIQ